MLTVTAPAKINLSLYLSQKRPEDGYHDLLSRVCFTELGDELRLEFSQLLTLSVTGEFSHEAGSSADNLVLAAARALNQAAGTAHGARIMLTKNLPVGAGLGGGSADAAATLKALNTFWELHLPFEALLAIGRKLGADVPMCLYSRPLIAHGIGEVIAPLEGQRQEAWMVLVHPRQVLLTKNVFAAISDAVYERAKFNHYPPVDTHPSQWWNDLQEAAITQCPTVADVITALADRALPGGQAVRMTGSGACCFALFFEESAAQACFNAMQSDYPHWWVRITKTWL